MNLNISQKMIGELKNSRFLGKFIQVDFSPLKTCTFNCCYCHLGKTTDMTMERREFYPPKLIAELVEKWIKDNEAPDFVFLTGSGEPSLYSKFGKLVSILKRSIPDIQLTAYSNASLLANPDVRKDFSQLDLMQFNLNAINPDEFRKINRHHPDVRVKDVLNGLKQFKTEVNIPIWIHSFFGNGINDSVRSIEELKEFISDYNPDQYFIYKFEIKDRVQPLTDEKQKLIQSQMSTLECKCNFIEFN
ncbi:MAG: radical SAM protein [Candidatus Hodarchaeota archaeon]